MCEPTLKIKLSDSLIRDTGGFPCDASISKCAHHAYLVYEIGQTSTSQIIAEFFDIDDGLFVSRAVLHPDIIQSDNPFSTDDGHANHRFDRFSLVDDDQGGPAANSTGLIRVRIFDKNFNSQAIRFDIPFAVGIPQTTFSAIGGTFSPNDKFLQLTYLIDATPNHLRTRLHILNASDLSDVATTDFDGGSYGAEFFDLIKNGKRKTYLAVSSQGGTFQFEFNNPAAAPPFKVLVYRLKNNTLKFITDTNLPALISTASITSFVPEEGNIAFLGASTSQIADSDPNGELQILVFDGRQLRTCNTKKTGLTTSGPFFDPTGEFLVINEQLNDGQLGFFTVNKFNKSLKRLAGPISSAPLSLFTFNQNSKWLLQAGASFFPLPIPNTFKNINLYRVKF